MLLCIDTGNTNTVFSVWDGRRFLSVWRISTDHRRTADEYFTWLSTLMSLQKLQLDITDCIISSTVPRVVFNLRVLCHRYFDTRPMVVGRPDCLLPVAPRVDPGTTVGPDRLVNAVGAFDRHGPDLIVVDFGTATTFDVVGSDGAYLGGVIAPGVNLSIEALHRAAARLPRIGIGRPPEVIGRSTVPAMQSGIYWGYVGLIEGLVARIRAEFSGDAAQLKVVATGGLAPLFGEGTAVIERIDPEITLEGLRLLAERNPHPHLPRDRTRMIESD